MGNEMVRVIDEFGFGQKVRSFKFILSGYTSICLLSFSISWGG